MGIVGSCFSKYSLHEIEEFVSSNQKYYSLGEVIKEINDRLDNPLIRDFENGFRNHYYYSDNILFSTILPTDKELREQYFLKIKEELKRKYLRLNKLESSFFYPIISSFDYHHQGVEWKPIFILDAKIEDFGIQDKFYRWIDYYSRANEELKIFQKTQELFRKKRRRKLFVASLTFLLLYGSSFSLENIQSIINDKINLHVISILYVTSLLVLQGLLALIIPGTISLVVLSLLRYFKIFREYDLRNSGKSYEKYYSNDTLFMFIIFGSVLTFLFNCILYYNLGESYFFNILNEINLAAL